MTETDVAVRKGGRIMRLVTNGHKAALFDRTGIVETLRVAVPATAPMRMPELESLEGTPVTLTRASKPCSCVGAPWQKSARDLRTQLT